MGKSISEVLTALTLCGANYRADSCKACPLNDSCKPGDNAALVDAATEAITDLVAFNALCLQEKAGLAELKKLVEERDAMAQQLSIFQTEPEAVAEVEAEPIDPDEIRRQAEEETRQQMAAAFAEERTQLEAKHKAAMSEAVLKAEQAAAAEVRKVKADAKKQAEAETRQQVAQAREEAAKAAAAQQEAKYRAELDQAKQAEEEAQRRAETMAKQMEASSDENAVRFFMLFEQLQQKVEDMKEALNEYLEALKVVDYWTGKVRELNGAFIYRSPSSNTETVTTAARSLLSTIAMR